MISQAHDREFEVFYDGGCPLCRREIDWLRRRDTAERIYFTDISAPGFDFAGVGKTEAELMAQIHGRLPNGELIQGVEVFRRLYSAVGFRRMVAISRWPVVKQALSTGYTVFAKLRLRLPKSGCTENSCSVR